MEIIDAQIHKPGPVAPWEFGGESHLALSTELAREAMDCVGVDVSLINSSDDFCEAAVRRYPERFAACGGIDPRIPDLAEVVAGYRKRPGFLAVRVIIRNWMDGTLVPGFKDGVLEPLFVAAEKHSLPVFLSAQANPGSVESVAKAHPDLVIIVDHLGLAQQPMAVGRDPWEQLPAVNKLARFPNVAVKFSGAPTLSSAPYPHPDIWPHLLKIVEAFTPDRLMWGSDFTRLRMPTGSLERAPRELWSGFYSDAVNFLRDTDQISKGDKEKIFAGTIRRLLRWPKPN
jgi:L-fuconolactonase